MVVNPSIGRVVIDDVVPSTPHGAPAKAIVGDRVEVAAVAFRDGTGITSARIRWRAVGGEWQTSSMNASVGDRFTGSIRPNMIGSHELVVEAWTDRAATWRRDVVLLHDAGLDISVELEEGAQILEALLARAPGHDRDRIHDAIETMRATDCSLAVRMAGGLDETLAAIVSAIPDPSDRTEAPAVLLQVERERAVFGAWYEFFPRSEGGFAGGAIDRLDAIAAMGFDVVYLPPIHPIGETHRKGRHNTLEAGPDDPGSPWAIGAAAGGHTAVEPSLGTLDDFARFVARAHELGLEVALDYALQCSPDHPWVRDHPEWFHVRADGSIRYAENPPKKYQDIHPIEFWPEATARSALWDECKAIVEFWARRGIRIFRVDNPHTKPIAFWDWMLVEIWRDFPDVVFLAEAFTRPTVMARLAEVGFSQSYTYFTWRNSAAELRDYVLELAYGPTAGFLRPSFWPTTPDILFGPLRDGSRQMFEMRAILASLLVPSYGIYSGYELCENTPRSPDDEEFFDSEKYRIVHRDWSEPGLAALLGTLNSIRRSHRCFSRLANVTFHHVDDDRVLCWSKFDAATGDRMLMIVNVDPDRVVEATAHLDLGALGLSNDADFDVTDELTGESWRWRGSANYVRFGPSERVAHVLHLGPPVAP